MNWRVDWVVGVPFVVLILTVHVFGLGAIARIIARPVSADLSGAAPISLLRFGMVMGVVSLLATILHGLEAVMWAAVYWFLGALNDPASAVLYSLSAVTSYGHADLILEKRWQLLGAIEALNGMMLFGLTTAFLFAIIQRSRVMR